MWGGLVHSNQKSISRSESVCFLGTAPDPLYPWSQPLCLDRFLHFAWYKLIWSTSRSSREGPFGWAISQTTPTPVSKLAAMSVVNYSSQAATNQHLTITTCLILTFLQVNVPGSRKQLRGQSARILIKNSQVQIHARAAGEFSSPGSTFCADSYFGISHSATPVLPQ